MIESGILKQIGPGEYKVISDDVAKLAACFEQAERVAAAPKLTSHPAVASATKLPPRRLKISYCDISHIVPNRASIRPLGLRPML